MNSAIENTENTGDGRGLATSHVTVRASPRGPRLAQPLVVQVSRRREQFDYHRRATAWWKSLTDDHRARVLETYRRYNGGFGNATDAMLWRYSARRAARPEMQNGMKEHNDARQNEQTDL